MLLGARILRGLLVVRATTALLAPARWTSTRP
jgi:hypothetical protein